MYRMATALAPYASHPDLPQFHDQVGSAPRSSQRWEMAAGGRHPPFDPSRPVHRAQLRGTPAWATAVAELEVQAGVIDAMGLGREAVVVLHVGGAAGGWTPRRPLPAGFERLSARAQARLVVENDDRNVGPHDVRRRLSERTGLRVVLDVLHHRCHDPAM